MNLQRIRFLFIEIYKTVNSLNPDFMKKKKKKKKTEMRKNNRIVRDRYKLNFNITIANQVTFGTNNLKPYGPRI